MEVCIMGPRYGNYAFDLLWLDDRDLAITTMRVTISHNRSKQEVKDAVDRSIEQMFAGLSMVPVEFTDQRKHWSGDSMAFSLTAKMGLLKTPLKGSAAVTDRDVTLELDFGLLAQLIPEEAAKNRIERSMKRLLT